ncbi:MFS transporter [Mycobacterium haemophilum]
MCTGILGSLSGNVISPALPHIRDAFAETPYVELVSRMIGTSHAVAVVLIAPFAGTITRKIRPRNTLIAGLLIYGVGGISGTWLPKLQEILIARVVLGVGLAFVAVAVLALIGNVSSDNSRNQILGRQVAVASSSGVLLVVTGGVIDQCWRGAFLIYSISGALAFFAWRYLPPDSERASCSTSTTTGEREREWLRIRLRRKIPPSTLAPIFAIATGQMAVFCIPIHLPFLIQESFNYSALTTTAIMVVQSPATMIAALCFPPMMRRTSQQRAVAITFLILSLGFAILWMGETAYGLAVGLLFTGFAIGLLIPTANSWILTTTPKDRRPINLAWLTSALFLGQFLSPFVSSPLATSIGIQSMFLVVAILCIAVAMVFIAPVKID